MLSRYLYLAGALPFLSLGAAHVIHTPIAPEEAKGLSPRDPALAQAMTRSSVRLTARSTVWRAWVGFNLSHSLGAIVFGLYVAITGRNAAAYQLEAPLAVPLACGVGIVYVYLARKYWFSIPLAGTLLSLLLFISAEVLLLLGR